VSNHDADVIVVGCGPVGVMLALRCVQRGLSVIAVDQSTEVFPLPRAIGMDEEIQQLFESAGLMDELRDHSTPMLGAEFVNADGERVVGIDLPEGTLGSLGYPLMVSFDQPGVERFLRSAAIDAGVDVRLGTAAKRIDDLDDGVSIELSDGSRTSTLTCRWLAGADGARSTVRGLRGITLLDQGFDQTWLVVDTTLLDPELPLPVGARQHCDPERICTLVPGHRSRRRWEFRLKTDETSEQVLEGDFVAGLLSPWGNPEQLQVDRVAVYRFHATVADRFRDGSVFLAGDAAHQMPPFNGQGMCSGMRDAENLAWKLAMVADGKAGDELLDSYEAERQPHVTKQVEHAVDAGMLIEAIAHDGEAALESGYGQRPFPHLEDGLIDGDHPTVGSPLPMPFGDRELISSVGEGWTLLTCEVEDLDVPSVWVDVGAAVSSLPADAYPGLVEPGMTVIIRPDRYVAAVSTDLAGASRRLAQQIGTAASAASSQNKDA
jgi:3-(3-hydroxy-phenyl)propionate hydroxylase